MDWNLEVLDKQMRRVAILEKAFNISYDLEKNKLSFLHFSLMYGDMKNNFCKPFMFIKLYENGEYVDMFRISPNNANTLIKNNDTYEIKYKCEHVLGTLLDKALFGWNEVGGSTVRTKAVIEFLLNKQHIKHWTIGTVDFDRQFHYGWENENLLSALLSIPKEFGEDYIFSFDTTVYPFKLSLKRLSKDIKSYIRYNRNMKSIERTIDVGAICTRLYPLGYGEGINQLKIDSVNPTGKSYIDAPNNLIEEYGLIEKIWSDRRYKEAENLYNAGKTKLESLQSPPTRYEVNATEFYPITKIPIDKFNVGDCVKVIDEELKIDFSTNIIKKSKRNIDKDYVSCTIDLSSNGNERVNHLTDLSERSKINELYSQGAVNIVPYILTDNADTEHPAKLRFKIPNEAVYINKVEISFESDRFRAYSKGNSAAESMTSGASSITSSGASSNTTSGASSSTSSGASSSTTSSPSSINSSGASSITSSGASSINSSGASSITSSGASSVNSSGAGGSSMLTSSSGGESTATSSSVTLTPQNVQTNDNGGYGNANHNHGISQVVAAITDGVPQVIPFVSSGAHIHGAHSHSITIPAHTHITTTPAHSHNIEHNHNIAHTHNIEHNHNIAHTHNIEHNHNIAHTHNIEHNHNIQHTHNIAHTHVIPSHNHDMIHGIFEGNQASIFEVKVDGSIVNDFTKPRNDFDIIPFLKKDDGGKVVRGWHEIQIKPIGQAKVTVTVMVQTFVNSQGDITV